MASDASFVAYVREQMGGAGAVTVRAMFGEYALYCGTKLVALVCDNQLFLKATSAGREFIGAPVEASPYPGAKPAFLIADRLDDAEWLAGLVRASLPELPEPKPRKRVIKPGRPPAR